VEVSSTTLMLYGIRRWAVSVVLADACRGAMFVTCRAVGAVGVDQSIHNTRVKSVHTVSTV
jgi:hypothetical protein